MSHDLHPSRALRHNVVGNTFNTVRQHFLLALLFSAVVNTLFLASPLYMMQLYGRVLDSRSIETLISLSGALLLALVAMAAADAARGRLLVRAGSRVGRILAPKVAASTMAEGNGGVRRALDDVEVVRRFLAGGSSTTLIDTPFTLLFLFVLYLLHPALGLVATFGAIAILLTSGFARLIETRRELRTIEGMREVERLSVGLDHDRGEVRALGLKMGLADRLAREHSGVGAMQLASGELSASIGAATRLVRLIAHSGALAVGAVLAINGTLAPSAMLAGAILAGRALGPIEGLAGAWRQAKSARDAISRLDTRLERVSDGSRLVRVQAGTATAGAALKVHRLVTTRPNSNQPVLRAVSFDVAAGETIAIAGPSGAGKSTLARCLVGAEWAQGGTVQIDSADIDAIDPEALAKFVGWMPQDAQLYHGSVGENIARFGPGTENDIRSAAQRAGIGDTISRLPRGYGFDVGPGGKNLPVGLRQSVALARALYSRPSLVVLDQPTAHMDADGEIAVINLIRRLKIEGVTAIVISHKPVIAALADRLMLLKDGAVELFEDRETVLSAIRRQSIHAVEPVPASAGQLPPNVPVQQRSAAS